MPSAAFTTSAALVLRPTPSLSACATCPPLRFMRMRTGPAPTEPEPSVPAGGKRDPNPLAREHPIDTDYASPVGGTVSPADFEDVNHDSPYTTSSPDAARTTPGMADLVDDFVDDRLSPPLQRPAPTKPNAKQTEAPPSLPTQQTEPSVPSVPSAPSVPSTPTPSSARSASPVVPSTPKEEPSVQPVVSNPEAVKSEESIAQPPSGAGKQSLPEEDSANTSTSIKMTPEQIEKAKAARTVATQTAEEKELKKRENVKRLLDAAESLVVKLGTKTRTFELGETARARAELFIEESIQNGAKEGAPQQDKLKGSAAGAAKSVVATVTRGWEEKAAPQILQRLPEDFSGLSKKALAALSVGLFVAVALLPSLFSGSSGTTKQIPAKKKLDAETAVLERKLSRERAASTYGVPSGSGAQKSVFPPEEKPGTTLRKEPESVARGTPTSKLADAPKGVQESTETSKAPLSSPSPVVPNVGEAISSKPTTVLTPSRSEVTTANVMVTVTKALGSQSAFISSASFDSLSGEPTVVLEVTKAFHRLPAQDQRQIADKALKATRLLGYERVSFIEQETGVQVAHAGVDIDLEDETENLRSQLASLHKQSDKLAILSANQESELGSLNSRLADERDEFVGKRNELEKIIGKMQVENQGLLDDLAEAKNEIAKIPDRLALEERTLEAETRSEKLTDTVEMLSKQLSKARDEEALAKQKQTESLVAVKEAERVRSEALESVASKIARAKADAQQTATEKIAASQNEAKVSVDTANKRVQNIEEMMAISQKEAARTLDETTQSYEKRLGDEQAAREKEVQTIQRKYESMLDDMQRKAKAELDTFQREADQRMSAAMKEAKAAASTLAKERDTAVKEIAKVESRAEKAAAKAAREKDGLQTRIARLETKLRGKELPVEAQDGLEGAETGNDGKK